MFTSKKRYVFDGEFGSFEVDSDQDGDIIIGELNGSTEALILSPKEALDLGSILFSLAQPSLDELFPENILEVAEYDSRLPPALQPPYGFGDDGEPNFIEAVPHVETPDEILERIIRRAIRKG